MALKFNTEKNIVWVVINEDLDVNEVSDSYLPKDGEAVFEVNIIDPKEGLKMIDDATKVVWERGQRFEKVDFYKLGVNRCKRMFNSWRGVLDGNGDAMPCDDMFKEKFYRFNRQYYEAISNYIDELSEGKKRIKEDSEKN